ncbi:tRNA epoxyqueuosine(34) reductase QueG [bacterium]|nr:tRNA epoxyqueuosine(34) reductase QueG [bacterium]
MIDIEIIKNFALNELNFSLFGVTSETPSDIEKNFFYQFLSQKKHGTMSFLENYVDIRLDPTLFFENYKSVIVVAENYNQKSENSSDFINFISKFAYGKDYHNVIRKKLKKLLIFLNKIGINGRISVDSAPVLEKFYAKEAGIGWQGRNSLIINKKYGSFIFLGFIFVDYKFENSIKISNLCGNCSKCIDACPTKALDVNGLNPSKCISYHTIESKESIPEDVSEQIFGCDICQNVCPWNNNSIYDIDDGFKIRDYPSIKELINIDEYQFNEIFQGSSIKRMGYQRFINQIRKIYQQSKI